MDSSHEKKSAVAVDTSDTGSHISAKRKKVQIYDPSKETKWTRAGISLESFKRAPGPTGCVQLSSSRCRSHADQCRYREQVIAGHANIEDIEGDMPLLQPKMKSRHLNMIAVGQLHHH